MSHSVTVSSSLNLPTAETPLLDAVRMYAEQGFIPIPMRYRTKAPKANGWQRAAPGVDAALERFEGWSTANIGLVMGGPLRLVAIDVDGDEGRSTKAALEAKHCVWPRTLRGRSGRADGGTHYVYRIPETRDIARFGCRSLGKNIQTRGPGGQIVACPSHHKDTGRPYAWDHVAPIADAPDWMLDMLEERPAKVLSISTRLPITEDRRTGALDRAIQTVCAEIINTPQGGRHEVVKRKAMFVLRKVAGLGLGLDPYIDQLRVATQVGGFHDSAVDSLLGWCASKAIAEPDSDDAWQPYTMQPGPQQDRAIKRGLDTPTLEEDWQRGLLSNTKGMILPIEGNALRIVEGHSAFSTRLSFNLDALAVMLDGQEVSESTMFRMRAQINDMCAPNGCAFGERMLEQAFLAQARTAEYSPVEQYLSGLVWDGESRIARICGEIIPHGERSTAEDSELMRLWLLLAVERVYSPGCQADNMIILSGRQELRKSTFFAKLFGEFCNRSHIDLRSAKEGPMQVHMAWGHEFQEVDKYMHGVSKSMLKSFMTTPADLIRVPYAKRAEMVPRRCIFGGTTNEEELLVDDEDRRYWIVCCDGVINIDLLIAWRDQLWAEAVTLYQQGARGQVLSEAAKLRVARVNAEHSHQDELYERIASWLTSRERGGQQVFSGEEVVNACVDSESDRIRIGMGRRVTDVMRKIGYKPKTVRLPELLGKVVKRWSL